jgi:hypothetical protein
MSLSKKKKRQQNQGTAMIVAIVVGLVLMVFALALLLLSYSLFSSAVRQSTQTKCRELAKSLDKELRHEITDPCYDSYELQLADAAQGKNVNNLWFYLRYNIWQSNSWPYYNEQENGHKEADSYKYFSLDVSDFNGMADKVTVIIYWEIDSDNPQTETNKDYTRLHVKIETEKGDSSYTLESVYILNVSAYDATAEDLVDTVTNTEINPDNNNIYVNERWKWELY